MGLSAAGQMDTGEVAIYYEVQVWNVDVGYVYDGRAGAVHACNSPISFSNRQVKACGERSIDAAIRRACVDEGRDTSRRKARSFAITQMERWVEADVDVEGWAGLL